MKSNKFVHMNKGEITMNWDMVTWAIDIVFTRVLLGVAGLFYLGVAALIIISYLRGL